MMQRMPPVNATAGLTILATSVPPQLRSEKH
jgi:hypothetical protein